jgi:hypothetical protein
MNQAGLDLFVFTQLSEFRFNHGVRLVLLRFYQKSGSFQGQKHNNASPPESANPERVIKT